MSASTLTGTGTIKAQDVRLEKNASIKVDISSGNKFVMKTDQGAELPYTAEGNNGKITDKDAGGEVARFSTVTKADGTPEEQTQTVTFTADKAPDYAGTYKDETVLFTISVITGPASVTPGQNPT